MAYSNSASTQKANLPAEEVSHPGLRMKASLQKKLAIYEHFTRYKMEIKLIPFGKYEKDFTFVVNGKRFQTSRFIADLLSPIICNRHYDDETTSEFIINTASKISNEAETFNRFLNLISSEEIEVTKEERKQFNEYFLQLGNIEDYLQNDPIPFTNVTADQIIDRLQFIEKNTHFPINDNKSISIIEKMVEFAAEHFNEISSDKIQQIGVNLLEEIIKRDNLKLDDEDSLLRIILAKYKENHSSSLLFEHVRFNEISQPLMTEFIENVEVEHLSQGTFRNICTSFYLSPRKNENQQKNRYEQKCQEFVYKGGNEVNGIFKHLTEETGGNINDNGTIEITSNSIWVSVLRNLVEFKNEQKFRFNNIQDSEICFDLKDKQIQITNYSIKSFADSPGGDHLKNWILEVSNDRKEWTKIDEHKDDSHLNNKFAIATFNTNKIDNFYRFIRLKQTGFNWNNDYTTEFYFIEFYGKLKSIKS